MLMPSIRKCNKKREGGVGKGGGGVTVIVFKTSDLKNVNFASFSTRLYNGVLWKTHFFGTSLLHKNLYSEKKRVTIFFQNLTQYGSMIEVYIKAKI